MPEESPTLVNTPTTLPDVLAYLPARESFFSFVRHLLVLLVMVALTELLRGLGAVTNAGRSGDLLARILSFEEHALVVLGTLNVVLSCLTAIRAFRFTRACRKLGIPLLTVLGLIFSSSGEGKMPQDSPAPAMAFKQAALAEWEVMLGEVDNSFSDAWWDHYRALVAKRRADTIASDELRELIALTDTIEEVNVHRMAFFQSASRRLGMSLRELMERFDLKPRVV